METKTLLMFTLVGRSGDFFLKLSIVQACWVYRSQVVLYRRIFYRYAPQYP